MRTQVSWLPFDDILFPLNDIFSEHIKCLSRDWDWALQGRERQASYELPRGGMGTELLLPPWPAPAGPFLSWGWRFPNLPAAPVPAALPDPTYSYRDSSGTEATVPTPTPVFRGQKVDFSNWTQ